MSTKRKIIFASIVIFIILLLLLTLYIIFNIKTISVSYEYNNNYEKLSNKEVSKIIKDSSLKKGEIIFTSSKNRAKENIERENPGIKVLDIQKVFPSKIKIVVFKTTSLFALETSDDKVALLDSDLNFINYTSTQNFKRLIQVKGLNLKSSDLESKEDTRYNGINEYELESIKNLEKSFDFEKYSENLINNREAFLNFVKKIEFKNNTMTVFTSYGIKIEYKINLSNLEEQIKSSLVAFNAIYKENSNYLNNIENTNEGIKEIKRTLYLEEKNEKELQWMIK